MARGVSARVRPLLSTVDITGSAGAPDFSTKSNRWDNATGAVEGTPGLGEAEARKWEYRASLTDNHFFAKGRLLVHGES